MKQKTTTVLTVRATLCPKKPKTNCLVLLLALALFGLGHPLAAQEKTAVDLVQTGLKVGQKVPDVPLHNLQNHKDAKNGEILKLSHYKDKLLILDFWATWCSPCLSMLPKMEKLEQQFKGQVHFLPVTYQSKQEVAAFMAKYNNGQHAQMVGITNDQLLHRLFPHIYLPHYVWIDGSGTVIAITDQEAINAASITAMLHKKTAQLPTKQDLELAYKKELTFMEQGSKAFGEQNIVNLSLTGYIAGLPAGIRPFPLDSLNRYRLMGQNQSLLGLYKLAYRNKDIRNLNSIVLKVRDTSKLISYSRGAEVKAWMEQNCYNFELMASAGYVKNQAGLFELMRNQMALLFPQYTATLTYKKAMTNVLIRTSAIDKLKSKGDTSYFKNSPMGYQIKNVSIKKMVDMLNMVHLQYLKTPVVDLTGYKDKVDLQLDADMGNIQSINKALAKYDLRFVEKEVEIPILTITDTYPYKP